MHPPPASHADKLVLSSLSGLGVARIATGRTHVCRNVRACIPYAVRTSPRDCGKCGIRRSAFVRRAPNYNLCVREGGAERAGNCGPHASLTRHEGSNPLRWRQIRNDRRDDDRTSIRTPCGGSESHLPHCQCLSRQCPPPIEEAERLVASEPYDVPHPAPLRGSLGETPPRPLPI